MDVIEYASVAGFRVDVHEAPGGATVSIAVPATTPMSPRDALSIALDAVEMWRGEHGDAGSLTFAERNDQAIVFRWRPTDRHR